MRTVLVSPYSNDAILNGFPGNASSGGMTCKGRVVSVLWGKAASGSFLYGAHDIS